MYDEGVIGPKLGEHAGDLLTERHGGNAEEESPDTGGVRERPEHVEHGTDADLAPHRARVAHGGVVARREHESHPGFLDAARDAVGAEVDPDTERLEHVRAPARARCRAIPVLGDAAAGGGGHDRAHRRDVEAVGAVAAGAHDVDRVRRHGHAHGHVAERRCAAGDLVDGFAPDVQSREECAQLCRSRLPRHHRGHGRTGLVARERAAAGDGDEGLTRVQ